MVPVMLGFYGAMLAVGLAITFWRGSPHALITLGRDPLATLALSVFAAAAALLLSAEASRRFEWARRLERRFKSVLGELTRREILVTALASGLAEEVLFRTGLQPALAAVLGSDAAGLLVASLLFGALHFLPDRDFLPWSGFATAMGLVLGGLFLYSGSVYPPVAVHVGVNLVNLHRINRTRPWEGE